MKKKTESSCSVAVQAIQVDAKTFCPTSEMREKNEKRKEKILRVRYFGFNRLSFVFCLLNPGLDFNPIRHHEKMKKMKRLKRLRAAFHLLIFLIFYIFHFFYFRFI